MRSFQKGIFNKDDDVTKHSIHIGYELTHAVKAELLLMGFKQLDELQDILTPELFEYTDNTEFIFEDEFERLMTEDFDQWLSLIEPTASIEYFDSHRSHLIIP